MKYTMYQIANMKDSRYGFMRWDFAKKHGFNINDYVSTYDSSIDETDRYVALEKLFTIFNVHRPENFTGHSLSVSDIVELDNCFSTEDGEYKTRYFYCDSFGWQEITEEVA